MNWEAIGAVGEIAGGPAVVISLIYLASQIRHSNRQVEEQVRALRMQAYDSAGADFSALRLHISGSPQIASVWRRAKDSYSALEPDERAQANELLHEYMWAYQSIFSRMEGGASGPTPNRWTVKCLCFLSVPKSLGSRKLPLRRRRRGVEASLVRRRLPCPRWPGKPRFFPRVSPRS